MNRPFAAYEGDEPYVFVCYAHADKGLVYPEITRLNDSGWHIWYDEGIEPGSEWSDSIATHVERCALFLYFVTPRSVQTEHCRREINFAIDQSRRVLAVHLLPTELPSGLKLTLSNRQAILKYDEPRSAYEVKLVGAIGDARSHHVSGTAPTAIQPITPRGWRPAWAAGTASALVVMAAGVGIWFTRQPMRDMRPLDRSLAVMPFSVIGGGADATTTYAEALTEDLRNVVTDYHELRSVAVENATNVARGTSYLADGNVQRLADGIRVRASLTRTVDHQTIWAQTFERPLTEGTADPTQLASTIGRFVRQNLVQDERCESVRRTARSEEAAAAYCAALAENQRLTLVGGHDLQLELSDEQRAIALDPALSDA